MGGWTAQLTVASDARGSGLGRVEVVLVDPLQLDRARGADADAVLHEQTRQHLAVDEDQPLVAALGVGPGLRRGVAGRGGHPLHRTFRRTSSMIGSTSAAP